MGYFYWDLRTTGSDYGCYGVFQWWGERRSVSYEQQYAVNN